MQIHVQYREQTCRCGVTALGKHRVEKTSGMAHLTGRFCFRILNKEQNGDKIINTTTTL